MQSSINQTGEKNERRASCASQIMKENEELDPRESELISGLVSGAYPKPDGNMSARVMEKIEAVRSARKKRASLFLRYGGIAACIVLIAGVTLAVVPRILGGNSNFMTIKSSYDAAQEEKAMAYDMDELNECEKCAGDTDGNGGVEIPEEISGFSYDMLLCSGDVDPSLAPETNCSQFAEGSGEPEICEIPKTAFMATNDNSVPESLCDSIGAAPSVSALIDIDGNGEPEYCVVTSVFDPEFELHITASVGDEIKYEAVFPSNPCSVNFEKTDGRMLIRAKDDATGEVTYYAIVAEENRIKLKQIG